MTGGESAGGAGFGDHGSASPPWPSLRDREETSWYRLAIGEAKFSATMGTNHLDRLRRVRDLLATNHGVTDTRLLCFSAAGFTPN